MGTQENLGNLEELNRRIAADVLIALIQQGRIKPGGAASKGELVIAETVKAYQTLLVGIHSAKRE